VSIREMTLSALRRQIRKDDPDDPRGWPRERLEAEVLRLREFAEPSTVVEARAGLVGTVDWWVTDAACKPPEVIFTRGYVEAMLDAIREELETYKRVRGQR
jgi:hypothetical protein